MRRLVTTLIVLALVASAAPAFALLPGTDIIVPAAGRGGPWITDLYIANPGDTTVTGTIYWLVRGEANPSPVSITFSVEPGATNVYADIIFEEFDLESAGGAFRVVASGTVIVNSRIYATEGTATFGQGFEGVPVPAATQTGGTATVVGLSYNSAFRTNIYATAGADGANTTVRLFAPDGTMITSKAFNLVAWEPFLQGIDQFFNNLDNFDDATLTFEVSAGYLVAGASKVDNESTDPTTLESDATAAGSASVDGTYQIAIYDSVNFAAGGNIVVQDGIVTQINATYFNWDKLDGGDPACTLQFLWGIGMSPTPLEDFASGVTFTDSYTSTGSGVMEWTVTFTIQDNMTIAGGPLADPTDFVTAVGSDFTLADELGCNGEFPSLRLVGGKMD